MNNPFQTAAQFAKSALELDPAAVEQQVVMPRAKSDITNMLALGLGAGVAGRGLLGLVNLARRRLDPPQLNYPGAVVASIPYPVREKEDEQHKMAFATSPAQKWWYAPGMVAAGGLGVLGGWKGLDTLLQSRRKSELDEDVDESKSQFERALLSSYDQPRAMGVKAAADDIGGQLGQVLDQLFDGLTKQAGLGDYLQGGLGGYLGLYALPAAAITGAMAYNSERKAAPAKILEKAMQRRAQRAYAASPSEILAVPHPVPVRPGASPAELEQELAESQQESSERSAHPFPA